MAVRPKLDATERVVRAITDAEWDKKNGRISPSLFANSNVSVSRLSVFSLRLLVEIFHRDFDRPTRIVNGVGVIAVGELNRIGQHHKDKPVSLTVEAAPEKNNEAHAEIPERITRGLANKIVDALQKHDAEKSSTQWAGVLGQQFLIWTWRRGEILSKRIRSFS